MYLLDTVVLSELRKKAPNPSVERWITPLSPEAVYISSVVIFEVSVGVERKRPSDPEFADSLADWLEDTIAIYGDRILPLTTRVARRWGQLAGKIGHKGLDLAIAATALEHGLTIVTRNVKDFEPTGVATFNPFLPAS